MKPSFHPQVQSRGLFLRLFSSFYSDYTLWTGPCLYKSSLLIWNTNHSYYVSTFTRFYYTNPPRTLHITMLVPNPVPPRRMKCLISIQSITERWLCIQHWGKTHFLPSHSTNSALWKRYVVTASQCDEWMERTLVTLGRTKQSHTRKQRARPLGVCYMAKRI